MDITQLMKKGRYFNTIDWFTCIKRLLTTPNWRKNLLQVLIKFLRQG